MSLATILIVVLLVLLIVAAPVWPHAQTWGPWPSGGIGVVLLIVLVLYLAGRI